MFSLLYTVLWGPASPQEDCEDHFYSTFPSFLPWAPHETLWRWHVLAAESTPLCCLDQWFPAGSLGHYAEGSLGKVGWTALPDTVLGEPMVEYQEGLHFCFIFSNKTPDFSISEWLPRIKTEFLNLPCSWVWPCG